jgi:N utilization substance protein B
MSADQLRLARENAFKFLYQCDSETLNYFSEPHFQSFALHFEAPQDTIERCRMLCIGTLGKLDPIDIIIGDHAKQWSVGRLPATDRCVLRMAIWELLETETSTKIILNEAIELAKKFGTEDSARFVNGLLDAAAKAVRKQSNSPN